MLEKVALEASLNKWDGEREIESLDPRLGETQRRLRRAGISVLIVFEGWDAAGKGAAISRLSHAFDPRGFTVHHVHPTSEMDAFFPPMHRFWTRLPVRGNIAVFNHSWYRQVLDEAIDGEHSASRMAAAYERIRCFERQLTEDGAVIIKFFLHITREEQAKRFKKLEKDPAFSWKVGKTERRHHKQYDLYVEYIEEMLRQTSMPHAPWYVFPATDKHYLNLKVAETTLAVLEAGVSKSTQPARPAETATQRPRQNLLDAVDLTQKIAKDAYNDLLPRLQDEVRRLQHLCYRQRRPAVIVFEGWDAAGKGGAIRRLTWNLDPRGYAVIPFGAPDGEEAHKHYLWRFWRVLQKSGHFSIFDRSWYGRVLVERVEGFATRAEYMRAYREINEFETELLDFGAVICKFWMHISREEQLRRFELRAATPVKQWKITGEDWRNRDKWNLYSAAVSDMLDRNSTPGAPWTIVEGNDKYFARLKVLTVVNERLADALGEGQSG